MRATRIDERNVVGEGIGGNFVVFVYEGSDEQPATSVDSFLLTEAHLPDVLLWLKETLPLNSCWSLGVVEEPERPTARSDLRISWVVGADVLNISPPGHIEPRERRLAEEMLARRHRVTLP